MSHGRLAPVSVAQGDFDDSRKRTRRAPNRGAQFELHLTYDEEAGGMVGPGWILEQGLSKPDYAISAAFSYAEGNYGASGFDV